MTDFEKNGTPEGNGTPEKNGTPERNGTPETAENRYQVLVVDDEHQILESLRRQLRVWAAKNNLQLRMCIDAREAARIIAEEHEQIAILLSDNRMPDMQGVDLIRYVFELNLPLIPIMLTGYTEKADIQTALSSGVFSLVVKPWNRDDLLRELSYALEAFFARRTARDSKNTDAAESDDHESLVAREFRRRFFAFRIDGDRYGVKIDYRQWSKPGRGGVGDYLDIIPINDDSFLVLVGSVSGHGLKPTFVAAIIKSMLYPDFIRKRVAGSFDPAELLEWINVKLTAMTISQPEIFMRLAACKIDCAERTATVANAGNPFPIHRTNGELNDILTTGVSLGLNRQATYDSRSVELHPGDTLFLFSDGVLGSSSRKLNSATLHALLGQADLSESVDSLVDRLHEVTCGASGEGCPNDMTFVRLGF